MYLLFRLCNLYQSCDFKEFHLKNFNNVKNNYCLYSLEVMLRTWSFFVTIHDNLIKENVGSIQSSAFKFSSTVDVKSLFIFDCKTWKSTLTLEYNYDLNNARMCIWLICYLYKVVYYISLYYDCLAMHIYESILFVTWNCVIYEYM